jgi:hypothetical protein
MIKPLPNFILFRPYWDHKEISIGDSSIPLNTSYEQGYHQPVRGEVVEVCERLDYRMDRTTLDWKTEMELQKGDQVVINYNEAFTANSGKYPRYVVVGGERLLIVRYDRVYAARRGDEVIALNGYNLVERMDPQDLVNYEMAHMRKRKHDRTFGIVRHVAKRLGEYKYLPGAVDDFDVEVGDIVVIHKNADLLVESPNHFNFFPGVQMMRIQRVYVGGIKRNLH